MSLLLRPTLLALAVSAAFPVAAQSNEELLKELRALKERVAHLEKKLDGAAATKPQWGMTPEQAAEFNRIAVKTEAIQDNFTDQGYKGLKISGYIEPTFVYNQRQNRAGVQFLNQQGDGYNYDTSYMGAAVLDLTKETDSGVIWKLTLAPNRGTGAVVDGQSIVQEATVSIPLGDLQTRLLVGQIADWSGYEYQQPTLNPLTSHNLLYDFTLPTNYTGVGMDIKDGKWWIRWALGNVNKTIKDSGDKRPVIAARVDYAKGEFAGWGAAALVGRATNFNTGLPSMAQLLEVDGYFTRGDITLQGQASFGRQKGAATNGGDSQWWGLSGLAGYLFDPRLQGLIRADYIRNTKNGGGLFGYTGFVDANDNPTTFDGRNGIGANPADPNRGANRWAVTTGLKYLFDTSTTLKLEYRLDGADRAVFEDVKTGALKKTNNMLAASVVVAF
ncbi:DUF3138 family protein [Ideonella sp. 4Y16]|uniref:DUF3138 family protein n=1 Tax=Ideonella alba TaxID=2824118 RepID=A0A941BED2_9BURK|nr:DUF3138 family protein [Ideonella alba]MBQ0931021.1 DUF3138 family protein [Ideonella alba]MBQ0942315.1 DUF3138 family protein [Ideonella alba]